MAEGPFSENGNPNFFSSAGEEWAILGEVFTHASYFSLGGLHSPFSILHSPRRPQRGVTPFSTEKLSYWLLFFLILHSPTSEKV